MVHHFPNLCIRSEKLEPGGERALAKVSTVESGALTIVISLSRKVMSRVTWPLVVVAQQKLTQFPNSCGHRAGSRT